MPGLLDQYIERLRGGDIKTFLTYQDALIKKYGKLSSEQLALATMHELLLADNLQGEDLVTAFNTQMLLEQLLEQCSPDGNVQHYKADRFYNTAKGRVQGFIVYLEDILLYKHYQKDELVKLLKQDDFLQHEAAINKHREATSKIHRDEVYAYKGSLGIPRSRDIDTYKQSNQGYVSFVQRFRNKLVTAPVDDSFNEKERDAFSRIYFDDPVAIPRKWHHYVEIARTFLETSPTQKMLSLFQNASLPKAFKEKFSALLGEAQFKNQQLAVMMAMVSVMQTSQLAVAADSLAKQMGFTNITALQTELNLLFKRLESGAQESVNAVIQAMTNTNKSVDELKKDLKSVQQVRFEGVEPASTEPKSTLQETHASEEDDQLIKELMAGMEGNRDILYKNTHNLVNELHKQGYDQGSSEYKLCLLVIQSLQRNPKTASLDASEQKTIFNFVINKFVKKLNADQAKYMLSLSGVDIDIQIGKKIGNYFDRPSATNYGLFTTEVYPKISDYIEKSDHTKQFSNFGSILRGPLTEYLKQCYTSEEFEAQNLDGFMVERVNSFFAGKADEILGKHFQLMAKQQIQDYLADIADLPEPAKEKIEREFLAHMQRSPHHQYKELKDFLLSISKPERVIPYMEHVIDNAIHQFMDSHKDLLPDRGSQMSI